MKEYLYQHNNIRQPETISPDALAKVDYFLMENCVGKTTAIPTLTAAHGFLCAVICSPNMDDPNLWLTHLLGTTFSDNAEEEQVKSTIVSLFNQVALQFVNRTIKPLFWEDDGIKNVDTAQANTIEQWCYGFSRGVELDTRWVQNEKSRDLVLPFMIITKEVSIYEDDDCKGEPIEDVHAYMAPFLADITKPLLVVYDYWRPGENDNREQHAFAKSEQPKIGRNAPCYCGSGKKYKRCCYNPGTIIH